jgi:C1A family cysteine protease
MKNSKVLSTKPKNKKNNDFKFDWRDENVISEVKSQKECGGCYAFTAAATIEGAYNIMMKQLPGATIYKPFEASV